MSKIQNIDHCWECKEHYDYGGNNLDRCGETGKLLSDIKVIPTWCPLPDKAGWLLIDSCPQDTLVWLWDGCEYGLGFAAQNPLDETATHYRIPSPPEVLSARIRPNCEAAPWVIEEVKILEEELRKALIAREYKYADYAAVLPVGGYGSESMDSAFYAGFFAARELKEK